MREMASAIAPRMKMRGSRRIAYKMRVAYTMVET